MTEAEVMAGLGTDVIVDRLDNLRTDFQEHREETEGKLERIAKQVAALERKQDVSDALAEERSRVAAVAARDAEHTKDRLSGWRPAGIVLFLIAALTIVAPHVWPA